MWILHLCKISVVALHIRLAKCSYVKHAPFLDFCKPATVVLSGHCIYVVVYIIIIMGVFHYILRWKYMGTPNSVLAFLVK